LSLPCLQILLKTFLGFEAVGDDDNRAVRENLLEQRGEKRPGGGANSGFGQHSTILQSSCEALHSGSLRDVSGTSGCR